MVCVAVVCLFVGPVINYLNQINYKNADYFLNIFFFMSLFSEKWKQL